MFTLTTNPAYPKNNPANPAYVKGFVYTIVEPNQQNGLSFSYQLPTHSWTTPVGVAGQGRAYVNGSRSGSITVSSRAAASFPETDVPGWSKAFKSSIAYYIEIGALLATDSGGALTADDVRNY